MLFRQPEGQVGHWLEWLQEYDFTIEHCPGRNHANADPLSRRLRRKHGSYPSCNDTEYVSTSFLQPKEGTSKPFESEFSWTAEEFARAQCSDPDPSSVIARMEEGKDNRLTNCAA